MANSCAQGALLVGSVPINDEEVVFRTVSAALGSHLKRFPDGEPGERSWFVGWQRRIFEAACPEVMRPTMDASPRTFEPEEVQRRLRTVPENMKTFYDDAALASWETFKRLQHGGTLPAHSRFQVCLPTAPNSISVFVEPQLARGVEPVYERALLADAERIQASIPHDKLAIQWDVAVEFSFIEGKFSKQWESIFGYVLKPWWDDVLQGVIDRVVRCVESVHDVVEVGLHLCYGDAGHTHHNEPVDLGNCVAVANGVSKRISRPLTWVHMPVPKDRDDEKYFAPLKDLNLNDGNTELYLGLVHLNDEEGTTRRIKAAGKFASAFGVATECGMGRSSVEEMQSAFKIAAAVSKPWA